MNSCILLAANAPLIVPIWEIVTLLIAVSISLLLRASQAGIFFAYLFTLHIAWGFFKSSFNPASLTAIVMFGILVLIIGLVSTLTETAPKPAAETVNEQ